MRECHAPIVNGVSGKVKIPKFIAERIEVNKDVIRGLHPAEQLRLLSQKKTTSDWMANPVNAIDLIKAINNGYEVEVEYLTWDQAYQGMKEGNVYLRYSKTDIKLDYYKLRDGELVFADKPTNELWRDSMAEFNGLLGSKFALVESCVGEQPQPTVGQGEYQQGQPFDF